MYSSNTSYNKEIKNLLLNYRSGYKIVKFNNTFYNFISNIFLHNRLYYNIYQNSKQKSTNKNKGYVEINLYENIKENEYKKCVYNRIKNKIIKLLYKNKYILSDITCLVRYNHECSFLSKNFINDGFNVNTSSNLLIQNYTEIQLIINLFYVITYPMLYDRRLHLILDLIKVKFLKLKSCEIHNFLSDCIFLSLNSFLKKISIYYFIKNKLYNKSIYYISEYIIKYFRLSNKNNIVYIDSFLDFVYRITIKIGNSISKFLEKWEQYKNKEGIMFSKIKNAINIITIHQSKGLQFPIVFIPFADWNMDPNYNEKVWINTNYTTINSYISGLYINFYNILKIKNNKKMQDIYKYYILNSKFDNINLLYVATTRSIEKLILFSRLRKKNSFLSFQIKNFLCYKKIWNNKKIKYIL